MITDPVFYVAAVPSVLIFAIAKGGFGGGPGALSVPLMALVIAPVQAAAILLPILCLMDLVSLWAYRGKWLWPELHVLVPASLLGIAMGTWLFDALSTETIRLMLGAVAVTFSVHHWIRNRKSSAISGNYPPLVGVIAAAISGFTSFVAHSGGPPLGMYLLRRGLSRTEFVATSVVFFAVVNYVKLIPYGWLGQLDASNLSTSLLLAPLAPVGVAIGVRLHNRISDRLFFRIAYGMLFVVGCKLIYDGLSG